MEAANFVVDVLEEVDVPPALSALLVEAIRQTLGHQKVNAPATVSLLLAGDSRLHQLNRTFMDEDLPTDVLSFPAGEPMPGMGNESGVGFLGDIALSLEKAARQAENAGHTLAAECQLLVVHGTLHLLGYDHGNADERAAMWREQDRVLDSMRVVARPPD
jgi:probable rRNA maturation factor